MKGCTKPVQFKNLGKVKYNTNLQIYGCLLLSCSYSASFQGLRIGKRNNNNNSSMTVTATVTAE